MPLPGEQIHSQVHRSWDGTTADSVLVCSHRSRGADSMQRISRPAALLLGAAAIAAGVISTSALVPLVASAQATEPAPTPVPSDVFSMANITVDQAREAFVSTGLTVGQTGSWDWTSPPVTSFQ